MRPLLRKVDTNFNYSFSIREDICANFDSRWYYHPQLELTLIRKGKGMQFVGDGIHRFNPGDIVLLGSNLPHLWKSDDEYFKGIPELQVEAVVIHFIEDFWGNAFLALPEIKPIKELLDVAKRGIRITGRTREILYERMGNMLHVQGAQRIGHLINILHLIAVSGEYSLLSSVGFAAPEGDAQTDRINDIYAYTFNNFQNEITIEKASAVSNISPNYFCRYFKSQTNKTYWQFLREVRIGYACRLLLEGKMNVSEIGYICGFNNPSNFNRQFKIVTKKTPLQYQEEYLNTQRASSHI